MLLNDLQLIVSYLNSADLSAFVTLPTRRHEVHQKVRNIFHSDRSCIPLHNETFSWGTWRRQHDLIFEKPALNTCPKENTEQNGAGATAKPGLRLVRTRNAANNHWNQDPSQASSAASPQLLLIGFEQKTMELILDVQEQPEDQQFKYVYLISAHRSHEGNPLRKLSRESFD